MAYAAGPSLKSSPAPALVRQLDPIPNMLELQSFAQDPLNGDWFIAQAVGDNTVIHRHTEAGAFVSSMTCVDAGHGSDISAQRDGAKLLIWLSWNSLNDAGKVTSRDVCRIQYGAGKRHKSQSQQIHVFTERYTVPAFDPASGLLALRTIVDGDKEQYIIRLAADCLANKNRVLGTVGPFAINEVYQGHAVSGSSLYRLTGETTTRADLLAKSRDPINLREYAWATGALVHKANIAGAGAVAGDSPLMSEEPEGVEVTSAGLLVGFKRGSGTARRLRIVCITPPTGDPPVSFTSKNGYTAAQTMAGIPGGTVVLTPKGAPESQFRVRAGAVASVFQYLLDQYQARVENIDLYTKGSGDDWGYTFRLIRGSEKSLSNHSSATAVDINAVRHPLATAPASNFKSSQISAIHAILNELEGAIDWGGDWNGRKDPMHFEIALGLAKLKGVASRIKAGTIHPPTVKPAPVKAAPVVVKSPPVVAPVITPPKPSTPVVVTPPPVVKAKQIAVGGVLMDDVDPVSVFYINASRTSGKVSRHCYYLQLWLNATGAKLGADGFWGAKTQAALDTYRSSKLGYSGADATGEIGLVSLTKLCAAAKSTKHVTEGK